MYTLYTSPSCGKCQNVKKILTNKGVPFNIIDIAEDEKAKKLLVDKGLMDLPALQHANGCFVTGGYVGILKEINK